MSKINNISNSMMSNPLSMVILLLLIILLILGLVRIMNPSFSTGVGINAHIGTIKGSINLEAFENSNGPQFVCFVADWCGHCKRAKPEINKLKEQGVKGVEIIEVDSDKSPELVKENGVQGFPTMRFYRQGLSNKSIFEDYTGDRTAEGMKTFLNRLLNKN